MGPSGFFESKKLENFFLINFFFFFNTNFSNHKHFFSLFVIHTFISLSIYF